MGDVLQTNSPEVKGFTLDSKNAPAYIGGIYLNETGRLVIQVTDDSLTSRRKLEKALDADDFIIEPITPGNYSQKELYAIVEELNKRTEKLQGQPVMRNVASYGSSLKFVEIHLLVNTPEKQNEFRKQVMDSPAFQFTGMEIALPNPIMGVNDTLGVFIRPEYKAYSTNARDVSFILYNRSGETIMCGEHYFATFEDEDGTWRNVVTQLGFVDIAYMIDDNKERKLYAYLFPDVYPNKPGRYRFFSEICIKDNWVLMMCEFRLTDKREEWEKAEKTPAP